MSTSTPRLFLLAALALIPSLAGAQTPPSIDVQVDRDPVSVGEPFSITIQVEAKGKGEPDIRLPVLGGLRVISRSESHPMSMSFSFGLGSGSTRSVSRRSIYEMVAVAERPGTYRIDPVVVTLDGRQYKSAAKTIRAVGRASGPTDFPGDPDDEPTGAAAPVAPVGPGDLTAQDLRGAKVDPDFFVQTHLSKEKALVGERLVLTVYVYFSRNISGVELLREPGADGLWVENLLPTGRRIEVEQVSIGGVSYGRAIQRRLAVFPVEPGKLTIAPPVAEYTMQRGFFSAPKTIRRSAPPVTLEVAALPQEGQPSGFSSTNVGSYSFGATVDRSTVKVGEPVTVTLKVEGEGNLRNVTMPELGDVDGFRAYAPELEAHVRVEGETVLGSRTSKTLLIARQPGEFPIPALSFSYFNPQTGKYDTVVSPERIIVVTESAQAGSLPLAGSGSAGHSPVEPLAQGGLERLNRRLRSIVAAADFASALPGSVARSAWFLLVSLGAPMGWIGFVLFGQVRRRRVEGRTRDRSKRADSEALRRLGELERGGDKIDSGAFHSELARTLMKFFEDRLEEPVSGDTLPELRHRLQSRGFESRLVDSVLTEMEALDFARFARAAAGSVERKESLERVRQLVRELAPVRVQPTRGGRR